MPFLWINKSDDDDDLCAKNKWYQAYPTPASSHSISCIPPAFTAKCTIYRIPTTHTDPFFDDEVLVRVDEGLSLFLGAAHEQVLGARGEAVGAHVLPQQVQRVVQSGAVDQVVTCLQWTRDCWRRQDRVIRTRAWVEYMSFKSDSKLLLPLKNIRY